MPSPFILEDHFGAYMGLDSVRGSLLSAASPYDQQIAKFQRVSPTGSANTNEPKRLVGGGFAGALDTNAWTVNSSGAGAAVTVTNLASVAGGTANGGYATIKSINAARFLFASANDFRGTLRIAATGVANSIAKWGAATYGTLPALADGFYFSYDGTNPAVNTINAGVVTSVTSGNFNGDVKSFSMDNNAHNYEIVYQVAGAWFFVDGVLLHKFKPATQQMVSNMHLPTFALVTNTGTSTGLTLEAWAESIVRYGSSLSGTQIININSISTTVCKIGPGNLRRIMINSLVSGNIITIYDNTAASGTVIASFAPAGNNTLPTFIDVDYDFVVGLTVSITVGPTSSNLTMVFD